MTREWFYSLIIGLILLAGGAWLVYAEMQTPPAHSGHIYVGVGVAILGALMINPSPGKPSPLLVVMKGAVLVVSPLVPWIKDRRKSVEVTKVTDDIEAKRGD